MSFVTFEEIRSWQDARALTKSIRVICKQQNAKKDFSWIDQISRASLSVMANIAEGNDADSNAGFIQFLTYAKRSATEVRSHLYYGLDEGYLTEKQFEDLSKKSKQIASQLASLIQYLRDHEKPYRSKKTSNQPTRTQ